LQRRRPVALDLALWACAGAQREVLKCCVAIVECLYVDLVRGVLFGRLQEKIRT
jgi:hypothetical protein